MGLSSFNRVKREIEKRKQALAEKTDVVVEETPTEVAEETPVKKTDAQKLKGKRGN